ncbi:protein FRA10AC1 isoform X2 [Hyalella azteca]|uniref:Protein FRA10AC1 isoform X2 n=1 Tax=Hyalella azteca TaxID=294128 RepID=A0A8B7N4P7_HYAAZ|nr:protein FRA10AC1 isoform X2 [Hyalella azteca]
MSDDYDSSFEGDSFRPPGCRAKGLKIPSHKDPLLRTRSGPSHGSGLPSRADMNDLSCQSLGQILRYHQSSLTAYDRHKILVNQYLLYHPGATTQLQRDSSRDVRDMDVVRAHHQFLWEAGDDTSSWQKALAKKYFDKLFKEYCICDLSRYKENKVGLRWRTQQEVEEGKGQFRCGEKRCGADTQLTSWEMNFVYTERGVKKNALVKLRLCNLCSPRLNHCKQRKQAKKRKRLKEPSQFSGETGTVEDDTKRRKTDMADTGPADTIAADTADTATAEESHWKKPLVLPDDRSRDEQFEEYLDDLLL